MQTSHRLHDESKRYAVHFTWIFVKVKAAYELIIFIHVLFFFNYGLGVQVDEFRNRVDLTFFVPYFVYPATVRFEDLNSFDSLIVDIRLLLQTSEKIFHRSCFRHQDIEVFLVRVSTSVMEEMMIFAPL